MPVDSHYIPLRDTSGGEDDDEENYKEIKHLQDYRTGRFIFWACIASLICTAVNLGLLVLQGASASVQLFTPPTRFPRKPLEFVSPYIGLENAVYSADAPPFPPITNFPMLLARVNASKPTHVLHDKHKLDTEFGIVYPSDRYFEVTSSVSTIAEFRIVDFGMERCTLNADMLPLAQMNEFADFSISSGGSVVVEIWRLAINNEIDPSTLSWHTKPRRTALVDRWTVEPGKKYETRSFNCPAMSLQAYEFSCLGLSCRLRFRQSPNEPGQAFYLTQRQSLF